MGDTTDAAVHHHRQHERQISYISYDDSATLFPGESKVTFSTSSDNYSNDADADTVVREDENNNYRRPHLMSSEDGSVTAHSSSANDASSSDEADDEERQIDFFDYLGNVTTYGQMERLTLEREFDEKSATGESSASSSSSSSISNSDGSFLAFSALCDEEADDNSTILTVSSCRQGSFLSQAVDTCRSKNSKMTNADKSHNTRQYGMDMAQVEIMAAEYLKMGHYDSALNLFEELLQKYTERGYHQKNVGSTLHNIATCHIRSAKFDIALPFIEEAVRLRTDLLGSEDVEVAASLHKLGIVLVSLKHFVSALQAFHRSLRIYRVAVGVRCSEVVEVLFKIGCLHYQVNEYMAALLAFEEALEMEEKLSNEETTIRKAEILCHLGFAKIKLQQYGDSIICLNEALSIQNAKLGENHIDSLRVLDSIAYAHSKIGQLTKSLESYQKMMKVHIAVFGENSGTKTLIKMSTIYERLNDKKAALIIRKRVLALQKSKLGVGHAEIARTKNFIRKLENDIARNKGIQEWI